MESVQMGSILHKRSSGITEQQWNTLLKEMEKNGMYLVIESNNLCVTKSPVGGFIPAHSKNDQFSLLTREDLLKKGLAPGHHILSHNERLEKHPTR